MKLMTYNILDGGGERLGLIAEIINDVRPDVVTINEANGFDKGENKKLRDLSKATSLPYFHLAVSSQSDYHVAILSKFPFKIIYDVHPLMRAGVSVVVDTDIGEVSIAGTHLTPYSESLRLPEIEALVTSQQGRSHRVLMGDMNSLSEADGYPDSIMADFNELQLKKFTEHGKLQYEVTEKIKKSGYIDTAVVFGKQKENTAPTASNKDITHANARLDYIFVSSSLETSLISYAVIKNQLTERASDHYPVVVELQSKDL